MKKKVGVYLNADLSCGGTFKYNQAIVGALAALPSSEYDKVVVYRDLAWEKVLAQNGLTGVQASPDRLLSGLAFIWRCAHLPLSGYRGLIPFLSPFARKLARLRCNLWVFPSQDSLCYQLPLPTVGVIHDLMHRYEARFKEVGDPKEVKIRDYAFKNMCRFSQAVLVDSKVGQMQASDCYQFPPDHFKILPFAIAPQFSHTDDSVENLLAPYQLPKKYIFYPAQFWPHKNHLGLIQAIEKVSRTEPNIFCVLVGSDKKGYQADVKRMIQQRSLTPYFKFLGLVDEPVLKALYQNARALIFPSFFGPTNIPPLEAFALGCAVGISDIYGHKAQLNQAALYFDPNSPDHIAKCIQQLWKNDALVKDLVEKGAQHFKQWNNTHFNQRFAQIVHQILS